MASDIIDGEVVESGDELVPVEHPPATLFGTQDPVEGIRLATEKAKAAADVIRKRNLISNIQGKEHVQVEGWTTLGSLFGVFPVTAWTQEITDPDGNVIGYRARVEARTLAGAVVGGAESRCMRTERNWKSRDDYALESMAQTRATSKALRQPLGFAMVLAGYNPTPAEELHEPAAGGTSDASSPSSLPPAAGSEQSKEKAAAQGKGAGSGVNPAPEPTPKPQNRGEQWSRALRAYGNSRVRLLRQANEMFQVATEDAITQEMLVDLIKAASE